MRRSAGGRLLAVLLTTGTAVGATVAVADAAAAGCRVDYTVASQWGGGFTTNVAVTNLGDPITAWRLTFAFGRDERVAQGWNATVTQSGTQVTAVNAAYNGSLGTGAATSFGFQASVTGTHTPPAVLRPQRHHVHGRARTDDRAHHRAHHRAADDAADHRAHHRAAHQRLEPAQPTSSPASTRCGSTRRAPTPTCTASGTTAGTRSWPTAVT
nr:hypothetical protein GCM10020092_064770 [Actinoplanes digitatis]